MKAVLLGNGSREGVLDGVKRLRPEIERVVEVVAADFANQLDLSGIDADVKFRFLQLIWERSVSSRVLIPTKLYLS